MLTGGCLALFDILVVALQVAVETGIQSLADFLKMDEPTGKNFDDVIATQLSFLSNENLVKTHLRKGRVEYNGKPNVAVPRIAEMLNPVYDYVQVVPSLISLTHDLVCIFLRLGTSIEIQKTNTKERYSL